MTELPLFAMLILAYGPWKAEFPWWLWVLAALLALGDASIRIKDRK